MLKKKKKTSISHFFPKQIWGLLNVFECHWALFLPLLKWLFLFLLKYIHMGCCINRSYNNYLCISWIIPTWPLWIILLILPLVWSNNVLFRILHDFPILLQFLSSLLAFRNQGYVGFTKWKMYSYFSKPGTILIA